MLSFEKINYLGQITDFVLFDNFKEFFKLISSQGDVLGYSIYNSLRYWILCFVISFISCFLVLIGSFWIAGAEPFNKYGLILLIVGGTILLVHILIGLFVGVNHFVEEKREEDFLDYEKFKENEPAPRIYYIEEDDNDKKDL